MQCTQMNSLTQQILVVTYRFPSCLILNLYATVNGKIVDVEENDTKCQWKLKLQS